MFNVPSVLGFYDKMENSLFSSSVEKEVSSNDFVSDEFISKCYGEVSYNIGSDWLRWGRHLGLSDSDLDNIGSDNKNSYEKADNVLKKWKQKNGNPSWEQLKKELMAFDRLDIVSKIRTKFGEISSSPNKNSNVSSKKGNWFSGNRKISYTGIVWILDRLRKSKDRKDYHDLFIECFYESQSSFTDEIKSIVERIAYELWCIDSGWISIHNGKTSYLTSCENYFINHYLKSGRKLSALSVDKNILSDEEKKLLIQCSTNVRSVSFYRPINFEGWKPKDKIEVLTISISGYFITKKDFEENFLPWINLCEELYLYLHNDFIKDICKWIRCSNVKEFKIEYRGNYFRNLDELKNFKTR
ncbi:uncharacterized protein LOC136075045 isoform X4 [Hydra vulgaris]|uniref:Uncharacterized protein LOC136075045 isoform X4 n=1 Tax=Hydra vulgaris TaxID=6087 RepID=A0ABM4B3F0_HYDVU